VKRVLFVDDEIRVLDGLRRLLRTQRHEWDMRFAAGGDAALAELEQARFDVIVTDMRMPGIDGASLLQLVQQRYPHTVRIVLSGHMEPESVLRAASVTHQYLTKPCDPQLLVQAVERACALKALLDHEVLRTAVGKMSSLPSAPRIYSALTMALADPNVSLAEVVRIVEQDVAMCANCLHLVNSAFFGLAQRITDIHQAVSYLGTNTLRSLVLSTEVFRALKGDPRRSGWHDGQLRRHAHLVASVAAQLVPDRRQAHDAFAAALLHDIGKLVLAAELPDWYERAEARARADGTALHEAEGQLYGVSHAEVGAYLLGLWGLPHTLVEAVAYHHAPRRVHRGPGASRLDVVGAVHIADALVHEQEAGEAEAGADAASLNPTIDLEYLEWIGGADRLPAWRAAAAAVVQAASVDGRLRNGG
jgi:HD-like signal output (HDOD) protein